MTTQGQWQWTPADLWGRIERGEPFHVLDLRNLEAFAATRIDGPFPIPTTHFPYYELLDLEEDEDLVAAVMRAAGRLEERLPRDRPVLAVCAQGNTSAFVAEGLRRLGWAAVNLAGGMTAWGEFYDLKPVVKGEELALYQIRRVARGCLSYVVVCPGGHAAIIDPGRHIDVYARLAETELLEVDLVLDTHLHADHLSGAPALAKRFGISYHMHPYDAVHPMDVVPSTLLFRYLREGQEFAIGSARIRVLHILGHTLGEVAFLLNGRYLFSGDSIFLGSVARPDVGQRTERWTPLFFRSLRRLLALPDETLILPAHFSRMSEAASDGLYTAPLGLLRERNRGLQMAAEGEAAFTRYILDNLPVFPPSYDEIRRVNCGLLTVSEERAREFELGKNVCGLAQRAAA
jgi:glyoxylase-like metal-dependent hydrolase (beta-lactamase superfamily II)